MQGSLQLNALQKYNDENPTCILYTSSASDCCDLALWWNSSKLNPDGEIDIFNLRATVLLRDTLGCAVGNKAEELAFRLTTMKSERVPATLVTYLMFADEIPFVCLWMPRIYISSSFFSSRMIGVFTNFVSFLLLRFGYILLGNLTRSRRNKISAKYAERTLTKAHFPPHRKPAMGKYYRTVKFSSNHVKLALLDI